MSVSSERAVIWDMDGVIADTGIYHLRAWQYSFRKRGVTFTAKDFQQHFGQRNDTIIRSALGAEVTQEVIDAIAVEKEGNYRQRVEGHIEPLPGAVPLIKALYQNGFRTAIASSAPPENIELILLTLGVREFFQTIAWGKEVKEGKPSPQIYLRAAEKLGVKPTNCLVIEDAVAGVEGAKRAGMKCIAVTNSHPRKELAKADLIVATLESVSVSDIERLLDLTADT